MGSDIFVVTQDGVYRHDIFGIFTDKDRAIELANELARTDGDNYHSYTVIPFVLDVEVKRKRITWYALPDGFHGAEGKEPIYSVRKGEI